MKSRLTASACAVLLILAGASPSQGVPAVSPHDPDQIGALMTILSKRGVTIHPIWSTTTPLPNGSGITVVVSDAAGLSLPALQDLAVSKADLVLIKPDQYTLDSLVLPLQRHSHQASQVLKPECADPSATGAGPVEFGPGDLYTVPVQNTASTVEKTELCYPSDQTAAESGARAAAMVRFQRGHRTITILSSMNMMRNAHLVEQGNASLSIQLLAQHGQLYWYPMYEVPAYAPNNGGGKSLDGTSNDTKPNKPSQNDQPQPPDLLPPWVRWVALQLLLTVGAVMLWRGRRLGPLVAERLPVVARAAETHEGHARLYRRNKARNHAAAVLRTAAARRMAAWLFNSAVEPAKLNTRVAEVTHRDPAHVAHLLTGPAPQTDDDLVQLRAQIRDLELQVRTATGSAGVAAGHPPAAPA